MDVARNSNAHVFWHIERRTKVREMQDNNEKLRAMTWFEKCMMFDKLREASIDSFSRPQVSSSLFFQVGPFYSYG